jgi:membrane-associated phospholipid phosphatase
VICAVGVPIAVRGTTLSTVAHQLTKSVDNVFVVVSVLLLLAPAVGAIFNARRRKEGGAFTFWWLVDSILVEFVVVDGLGKRFLTALHRPNALNKPGFPSGHATFAFILAYLVWMRYPKLGPVWFVLALAISWSRLAVGAHYPYQVFGGAVLGLLIGYGVTHRNYGILLPRILVSLKGK